MTELPDDIREPLHSLQADLDWLIARIRAEDNEVVSLCKESIRNRLSQIEEAAYRLNGRAEAAETALITSQKDRVRLWNALDAVVTVYVRDNPVRTGDVHDPGCTCMRCAIDNARAALEAKP